MVDHKEVYKQIGAPKYLSTNINNQTELYCGAAILREL